MSLSKMTPSREQQAIIDAFISGADLAVQAGAGTGKSTTLAFVAAAQKAHRPGAAARYITFNKRNAVEVADNFAKYGLTNAQASTAHSMAYRACVANPELAHMVSHMKRDPMRLNAEMKLLGIPRSSRCLRARVQWNKAKKEYDSVILPTYDLPFTAQRRYLTLTRDTVRRFCQSSDAELSEAHVPYLGELEEELRPLVTENLTASAQRLWSELSSPEGRLKTGHDHYLKAWALTNPAVGSPGDVILYDEAQDCQPEGTKVLTTTGLEAIENIRPGDKVISYTPASCRLRMGGSTVTSVGVRDVDEDIITVRTESGSSSRYTGSHICLAKIGPAVEGKTILYLMRRGTAWRVGVTSAHHGKTRKRRVSGVVSRLREENGDAIWILDVFDTKLDALTAEARIPAKFGIPEMRFIDNGHQSFGQDRLDDFWADMGDLTESASRLLASYGRSVEHPLVAGPVGRGMLLYTRATTVRACNLLPGMLVLDAEELLSRPRQMQQRFGDSAWTPITVERERYSGRVWSLDVEGDHTYVADGIVTHNCNPVLAGVVLAQRGRVQLVLCGDPFQELYSFTGSIDAMQGFQAQPGVITLPLNESRRFGQTIANEANEVLDLIDPEHKVRMRLIGIGPAGGQVFDDFSDQDQLGVDAVVCSTNRQVIENIVRQSQAGRRVYSTLDLNGLVSLARDVEMVESGQPEQANEPVLRRFTDLLSWWAWLESAPAVEEETLHAQVQIVREQGAAQLQSLANTVVDSRDKADVTVSTIHKAKGGTWTAVFVDMGEVCTADVAKLRMLYVAVTRAESLVLRRVSLVDPETKAARHSQQRAVA